MEAINYFNSVEHIEPKCNTCQTKIEFDISTTFDEKLNSHVCNSCGEVVK